MKSDHDNKTLQKAIAILTRTRADLQTIYTSQATSETGYALACAVSAVENALSDVQTEADSDDQ